MSKAIPNGTEIILKEEELFFSRTDKKGIILSGNDVFVRISGFARERLVGSPHNIVRHPEMPKAVFKLFWETIEADRPICAYVKNMAADGSFYWVFATAFPLPDGYLSVRIKPSTPIFSKIKEVYPLVLEKEKREGVDAAKAHLLELLKKEGFASYEAFMGRAIVDEVRAHRTLSTGSMQRTSNDTEVNSRLRNMLGKCTENSDLNALIFSKLEDFAKVNSELSEKSAFILKSFKNLDLLAVNMSTAAKRLGSEGATLVAVSNGITKSAGEFKVDLNRFNDSARTVGTAIGNAAFQIASSQLQVAMIRFYIYETLEKWLDEPQASRQAEMRGNAQLLLQLAADLVRALVTETADLKQVLVQIGSDAEQLRSTINGVEIIRKTGVIEAAQVRTQGSEFDTYFKVMNGLVGETSRKLATFGDAVRGSVENVDTILPALAKISNGLSELLVQTEKLAP